jgi:ADP-ribose pyrophosphatase
MQRVRVGRRLACENQRFSVYFDNLSENGKVSAQDYLIVAPKQVSRNFVTGVAIVPICEDSIGLLKIYRHSIQNDSWEIPRGFVETGESDLTAALRELEEETGLTCRREQIKSLGFVTPDPGVLAARIHIFAALRCFRNRPYTRAETGHREFRVFSLAAFDALVQRSQIQDPCTIIARYKLSRIWH